MTPEMEPQPDPADTASPRPAELPAEIPPVDWQDWVRNRPPPASGSLALHISAILVTVMVLACSGSPWIFTVGVVGALVLSAWYLAGPARRWQQRRSRFRHHRCRCCGYDLRSSSLVCSECGVQNPHDVIDRAAEALGRTQ